MARIDGYSHDDEIIGRQIMSIRNLRGKSREDLASFVGCTHQQIAKYEDGTNSVSAPVMKKIAEFLECPLLQLYGLDDNAKTLHITRNEATLLAALKELPDEAAQLFAAQMVKGLAKHFGRGVRHA